MRKAVMLLPYIGPLPHWMDLFLLTASRNPSFRFVLYSDQPFDHFPRYENVDWRSTTLGEIRQRFTETTGLSIPEITHAYKLNDFKTSWGELFSDEIKEPFWGYGDIDMIWGQLDQFFGQEIFDHDIISADPGRLCGPFTLWRNTREINALYRNSPDFERVFLDTTYHGHDEIVLTKFVTSKPELKIAYDAGNHGWPGRRNNTYQYIDGKVQRAWQLKDVLRGHLLPTMIESAFFHLLVWKHFSHDFDPTRTRGWTIRQDRFEPIR